MAAHWKVSNPLAPERVQDSLEGLCRGFEDLHIGLDYLQECIASKVACCSKEQEHGADILVNLYTGLEDLHADLRYLQEDLQELHTQVTLKG